MLKTNILFRIARLHSPHLLGGAIGRLIVTENDLCPTRQRRNTANGIFNVSFLVFAWNDDRYGKVFQRNRLAEPFAQRPPASCRVCSEMAGARKNDSKNQTAGANTSARERFDASQELQNRLASTNSECQQWKASSARCAAPSSRSIPQR